MNLISEVNRVYCLLLDKRYEEKEFVHNSLQSIGLSPIFFLVGNGGLPYKYDHIDVQQIPPVLPNTNFYPSWLNKPNAYNAYLSHEKILKQAKESKLDNVMLVEDDIFVENDFNSILKEVEPFFEANNWDMIYFGGYHHPDSQTQIDKHLLKLKGSGGWHGVLMKTKVIDHILSYGPIGPMDWICGQYIHQQFDCYAIYPSIISQKDGHSFVEGHHLTKPPRDKI